jgi:predicted enzyme related to lactoylglutathione lyase
VAFYGETLSLDVTEPDGDIEAEVSRLRDAGVEFSGDVSEHPWGRIVPFKDPDGNDLQLYSPPA